MFKTKVFKKRYIATGIIFLGLGIGLAILPEKYNNNEMQPQQVLLKLNNETRYVSTDFVADRLINKDNYIQLIDVRTPQEFAKFSLPGAINIPLATLLDKDEEGELKYADLLNSDTKHNIFYSNGTVYANQAWMMVTRKNYKNNFVMKGGLNLWVETILLPKPPESTASIDEFNLYNTRRAASMYFGGGSGVSPSISKKTVNTSAPVKIKKAKQTDEGGC